TLLVAGNDADGNTQLVCWDVPAARPWRWIIGAPAGLGTAVLLVSFAWKLRRRAGGSNAKRASSADSESAAAKAQPTVSHACTQCATSGVQPLASLAPGDSGCSRRFSSVLAWCCFNCCR